MAGVDSNRGAKRAREARAALGLGDGALPCLLRAVERAGYPVVVAELPDGVAGACYRGELLWVNGAQPLARRRFTLAHELGHAWCRHDGALEPDTVATLSGRTSNPYEIQANAFAAEFLVPRAGFALEGEPTLEDVVEAAARYGVSAIVIVYRLRQLKRAPEERIARLQQEIEDGLHAYLGPEPLHDGLAEIEALPYLSPALEGSLLAAALRNEAAVDAETARAVERITRPGRR
jgi:Zn-dependent peptidase ImmA (M78 family)